MSRRLQVLHVHSGNMFGGIESILVTLARYRHSSMKHTFALCFTGRLEAELRARNADVRLTSPVRLSRPGTVFRARKRLHEALHETCFDVALCHSSWSRAVFGPVPRAAGKPLVIWQHSAGDRQHWLDRMSRKVPVELALCNSRYTAGLQALREPASPTAVVYPPVPPPSANHDPSATRHEVRAELGISDDTASILQAGRLEPGKGHTVHLEAAAALADLPNWTILQAGGAQRKEEQRYRTELEKLVRKLGLEDRVKFLGERTDMHRLYAAADIYCQPNTLPESFGMTFVEALYAGVPVVTTKIGAAPEIVNEECGVLVPKDDAAAVAAAIRELLLDAAARVRLGRNGPGRAKALCDPEICTTRLHDILSEFVAE